MKSYEAFQALLQQLPRFEPGQVWLAGAGPGDPGCLTLDALAALAQADKVVHDALVDPRVLALAKPEAELIFAGKRGGKPSAKQADITDKLVLLARSGYRVLRLKGGDPYIFGRGGEETLALAKAGIAFRVIPGVTAGLAGLTAASIPATMRGINHALILATGHGAELADGLDWMAVARLRQPIVLYMAMKNLNLIVEGLLRGGLEVETPAAVIVSATTPAQRVLVSTLGRVVAESEAAGLEPPAVVAIGGIVALREELLALAAEVRARAESVT